MTSLFHRERGTGMPLVLLHAFPYDSRMWHPQMFGLPSAYRMIAPDMPGFGQSALVPDISIDGMADKVLELLDGLKLSTPVVLAGVSMGGYVALSIMRKAPERVRKLILADTRCEADDDTAKANRAKAIEAIKTGGAVPFAEAQVGKQLSAKTLAEKADVATLLKSIGTSQTADGMIAALTALKDRPDATAGLAKITIPTHVIVGADDVITPPALAEKMHSLIKNSTLTIIPGAGHISNLENPEAFNGVVEG